MEGIDSQGSTVSMKDDYFSSLMPENSLLSIISSTDHVTINYIHAVTMYIILLATYLIHLLVTCVCQTNSRIWS